LATDYAFGMIGELTYSRRLGFVDQGNADNVIGNLEWLLNYAAPVRLSNFKG
jgi:hypothetical protein